MITKSSPLEHLYRWLDHTDAADDLALPEVTDPRLLGVTHMINACVPATYGAGSQAMLEWLTLEALRVWLDHGPARPLLPVGMTASAAVGLRGDYAAAYRASRRLLAFGEARGYEPDTSQVRMLFALFGCWFEAIESAIRALQRARQGLVAGGDLAYAGYTYETTTSLLFDSAASLDNVAAEVEAGLAFARRTGNEQVGQWLDAYRWLGARLRSESSAETVVPPTAVGSGTTLLIHHVSYAYAAAMLNAWSDLARHTAVAFELLPAALGHYLTAIVRVLRGLSLAEQARAGNEDAGLLSELDELISWLSARAVDAPDNFLHLLRLLEAERAWAAGDFRGAALAFDAARREVAQRQRPWHRALIAEHAARFYLVHGMEQAGHELLSEARQHYLAWGATAKVDQLDWAYPRLRPRADVTAEDGTADAGDLFEHRPALTTGTVDLLGILSACQAVSSETSIGRLQARVTETLRALAGATDVHLLSWDEDRQQWVQPAPGGTSTGAEPAPKVPVSVLRYMRRVREPLVLADARTDDRFARDPYFSARDVCSLLALPILSGGRLRALLLLENDLMRNAFTIDRLDTVRLIAGQLAVSLDNAQVYAEFRRVADEQAALRRVATLVARGEPPDRLFSAVAAEVGQLLREADMALVGRYSDGDSIELVAGWSREGRPDFVGRRVALGGKNVATLVSERNEPARVDTVSDDEAPASVLARSWVRSAAGTPINVEGRLWGVMTVGSRRPDGLPAGVELRLAAFTELVATAIANAQAQADLAASRARVVASADETRRKIERDLHDGAQSQLVALALRLRAAQAVLSPDQELAAELDRVAAGLNSALEELRELARGIHPAGLAASGLGPAVRTLARRSPIPVKVDVRTGGRLPEPVEVGAYYVVSEALANAIKHSEAPPSRSISRRWIMCCESGCRMTGSEAPNSPAGRACSGCATASRRSAATSR